MRRVFALFFAVVATAALAGCGGNNPDAAQGGSASSSAASEKHNQADVMFVRMMIPHHRQAIEMAKLAPSRAASPEVKKLTRNIIDSQSTEIELMTGWLKSWDEQVPASGSMGHGGHGMSGKMMGDGGGMAGMMSQADIQRLKKLSGERFDEAFLRMMIPHHNGAIQMTEHELGAGAYGPAKELARNVTDSQSAEIKQMRELLQRDAKQPTD